MVRKSESIEKVDKVIGGKIHELRISMGFSRQQLATKIGVTHQQLQKYEKGTNRISPGRLLAIAKALNKTTAFFFEGLEKEQPALPLEHRRMAMEVSRNFMKMRSLLQQQAISNMIKVLATGK